MPLVDNKRIAKNTILLYIRMIVLMVISLFTSRVILDSLGVEDFGTYNVVGGFVTMFSMLSGPIANAIQRFLTFELGTGNHQKLRDVFSTSVNIQILLAALIVLLCEVVGLWFLHNKMSIPDGREGAASFVLQISIANFVISLLNVPFNALIVAHERMNIYAFFGIFEAVAKLGVAYMLFISPFDKLKLYASLLLAVTIVLQVSYRVYCKTNFKEAKYRLHLNKSLFKEMASFSGWNFLGNSAYILNTQGVNMLMNVFFGVTVNAARAIAVQVDNAILQLVNGFITAINPQITKSYASSDKNSFFKLINRGAKFSYLIMFIIVVPLVLETKTFLTIWLKVVPLDTVIFVRLVVIGSLMTCLGGTMNTGILATGNIKRFQIVFSLVSLLVFPVTWLAYRLGAPAYATYIIFIIVYFLLNFVKLAALKRLTGFPVKVFFNSVLSRVVVFSIATFLAPILIVLFIEPSLFRLLLTCVVSVLWSMICVFLIGMDLEERDSIIKMIKKKILFKS